MVWMRSVCAVVPGGAYSTEQYLLLLLWFGLVYGFEEIRAFLCMEAFISFRERGWDRVGER